MQTARAEAADMRDLTVCPVCGGRMLLAARRSHSVSRAGRLRDFRHPEGRRVTPNAA
jgi:hypothetical protein